MKEMKIVAGCLPLDALEAIIPLSDNQRAYIIYIMYKHWLEVVVSDTANNFLYNTFGILAGENIEMAKLRHNSCLK